MSRCSAGLARGSPVFARASNASQRVSSSESAIRAASASWAAGEDASTCPSPKQAQSRTSELSSRLKVMRDSITVSRQGLSSSTPLGSAPATASRTSPFGWSTRTWFRISSTACWFQACPRAMTVSVTTWDSVSLAKISASRGRTSGNSTVTCTPAHDREPLPQMWKTSKVTACSTPMAFPPPPRMEESRSGGDGKSPPRASRYL